MGLLHESRYCFRSIYGAIRVLKKPIYSSHRNELGIRDNDAIMAITFCSATILIGEADAVTIDKLISQSLAKYASSLDSARRLAEIDLAATKARIEQTVSQAVVTSGQREIARPRRLCTNHGS